ncbi:MAG: ACT domain-containing protein [Rhizobiaceae bacterium]
MPGETNLTRLLATMRPRMQPNYFLFVTLPHGEPVPDAIDPVMVFWEDEGRTLIVEHQAAARAGLAGTFLSRMITLDVHSSLDAVGFLAAITARLAAHGMPVNPVSAYHHDHLFVPADREEEAVALLERLAREAAAEAASR